MNTKKTLIGVFVVVLGLGLSSFKDDDRNFQIAKIWISLILFSRSSICFMSIRSILRK